MFIVPFCPAIIALPVLLLLLLFLGVQEHGISLPGHSTEAATAAANKDARAVTWRVFFPEQVIALAGGEVDDALVVTKGAVRMQFPPSSDSSGDGKPHTVVASVGASQLLLLTCFWPPSLSCGLLHCRGESASCTPSHLPAAPYPTLPIPNQHVQPAAHVCVCVYVWCRPAAAGDALGVCELMLGGRRAATLTADSMVQVLVVPAAVFLRLVSSTPGVCDRAWQATGAQLTAQHHHLLGEHRQLAPLNMFFRWVGSTACGLKHWGVACQAYACVRMRMCARRLVVVCCPHACDMHALLTAGLCFVAHPPACGGPVCLCYTGAAL